MTEALIVNGVIIANGVADSDGDVLSKKDIKTIFMKYQRDTDTMHTNIKNFGVEVFASWISEIDTQMAGKVVPAGSWLATLKVTNEKLIQCIEQGKLNGFSLGSVSDKAYTPKYWFINKSLNYRDIKDIEEVIPLFISFVDKPANQYGWEVMTYDAYINKNEKDVEEMTDIENKEEMISVSALEKIKGLFVNKSEEEKEETVEKAEEEPVATTEASADETVTALFEKLDTIIEQNNQILEAVAKAEETVDEEEEIEKADEDEEPAKEEEVEKAEEEDESSKDEETEKEKSEETEDDETVKKAEEESKEDDVRVDKRETNMIENQVTTRTETFYQKTGRDSFGRKIKN